MAPNFANGKVYCIRNRNDGDKIVYVGSTTRPLSERMADHRKSIKRSPELKIYKLMGEVGVEHFHIELLVDFPCERKEQLLKAEGEQIRKHNTVLNGYNTQIAGRSQQEYMKEYELRPDRIVKKAEHMKESRKHPEVKAKAAGRSKEYSQRPENKAKIAERMKEYMKEYNKRPEAKAKRAEYRQRYADKLAAAKLVAEPVAN